MEQLLPLLNSLVLVFGGGVGVWLWRAERKLRFAQAESSEADAALSHVTAADKIKTMAMGLLEPLNAQIDEQKEQIDKLTGEVRELRQKVEQYIKDEAVYQAELHQKDKEIAALERKLDDSRRKREALESRVLHLEDVCKRAGINGHNEEEH